MPSCLPIIIGSKLRYELMENHAKLPLIIIYSGVETVSHYRKCQLLLATVTAVPTTISLEIEWPRVIKELI